MNALVKIKYYFLVCIIILISGCDSSDTPVYESSIIKITGINHANNSIRLLPASTPSSSSIPLAIKEQGFTNKKQKNISNLILKNHYKNLDFKDINAQAINAVSLKNYLHKLDPYSKYFPKNQYQFIKKRSQLKRLGAGFNLLIHKDKILLIPIFATPLYQAGLQMPQYLQSINQHKINYQDFSSYAFLSKIKSGDKINIAVKQENTKQNKIYTVKAKKYQRQLDYYSEKNGFAIIRIDEFREGMQKKLSRFLKKINNKKPLIIDLRYCPGGDLFAAVDMLSPFLGKSKTVAYLQKDKSYRPVSLKSIQTQRLLTQPIYLLSSPFTASSAEVFIRAIKQNVKNSYIVGVPTQGKCVAQESYILQDQSALLLSSYKILSPDQKNCDQIAIIPDQSIANIELLSIEDVLSYLPK
jgi:carboxyl-terminal processing protease